MRDSLYELYDKIEAARKFTEENGVLNAVYTTGEFNGIHDYGAGVLGINIYSSGSVHNTIGFISIYTIDDGGWQAYPENPLSIDICRKIAIEMSDKFNGVLPTEEEFNEFLQKFKLYGTATG